MSIYQNHVIDPTFFFDAIEEFSFNYQIYVLTGKDIDENGNDVLTYDKQSIRGSLQSSGTFLSQTLEGNTTSMQYNFHCKSLYRINIGDVIFYKDNYLMVMSVQDYDEFGCRSCALSMIQLSAYRDLAAYIKYLQGQEFI